MKDRKEFVEAVFRAAVETPGAAGREAFLVAASEFEPELRLQVERWLDAALAADRRIPPEPRSRARRDAGRSPEARVDAHAPRSVSSPPTTSPPTTSPPTTSPPTTSPKAASPKAASPLTASALTAAPPKAAPASLAAGRGTIVGPYALIEPLSEGRVAAVYLAQIPSIPPVRAALKLIEPGADADRILARFAAERSVLLRLDHPHIARLLGSGVRDADGGSDAAENRSAASPQRYFASELVSGVSITRHARDHGLGIAARLGLFLQVCDAVGHAHLKGLLHGALKPSNVLVGVGNGIPQVKVTDFGIARSLHARLNSERGFTALDKFVGTPAYLSPEQTRHTEADLDTRSDIYSLGILLYELLTERLPWDPKTLAARDADPMRQAIGELAPPSPSQRLIQLRTGDGLRRRPDGTRLTSVPSPKQAQERIRHLKGDLDWIVMHCLEKEPQRRYQTVDSLALDLRRFLARKPILAHTTRGFERFLGSLRRHPFVAVSFALAAITSLLGTGSVWLISGRRPATPAAAGPMRDTPATQDQPQVVATEPGRAHAAAVWIALHQAHLLAESSRDPSASIGERHQSLAQAEAYLVQAEALCSVADAGLAGDALAQARPAIAAARRAVFRQDAEAQTRAPQ